MTFDPMIDQELGCTKQIRTKWIIVGRKTATLGQFNRFAQIKSRFYGEKSAWIKPIIWIHSLRKTCPMY